MEILRKYNKNKGYTLVELLAVLALLGIVLSIAIPSFKAISNIAEKKELMEFKREIIYARNRALMERETYTLRLEIPDNKYLILKDRDGGSIVKEKPLQNGTVLRSDNLNHFITFHPTGSPDKGGYILLTNRKRQNIRITITPATGKVNLKIDGK